MQTPMNENKVFTITSEPKSLKVSTSVEKVKDVDCSIQDPCVKLFHTQA